MMILEQLFQFLLTHWILSAALLLVIILLILDESQNSLGRGRISLQDATILINHQQGVWIDLREIDLFNQGHINHAFHFPEAKIMTQLAKLKKYQNTPMILVDHSDTQASQTIANQLRKQDFKQVHVLGGGMRTWIDAKLPLKKTSK